MTETRPEPVLLRFDDWTAAISAEDAGVRRRVAEYFRPFVLARRSRLAPSALIEVGADAVKAPAIELQRWDARGKDSFGDYKGQRFVRKNRTGVFMSGRDGVWRVSGDLRRNFPQLVNLIGTLYGISVLDRGASMLHASAAVRDGQAVAIVGESGTGKSSVMVRLLEHQFDYLTNDRLLLLPAATVASYGIPKLPRINPGTLLAGQATRALIAKTKLRNYERLTRAQMWRLEDKTDLDVRKTLGRAWLLKAPLAVALILAWRDDEGLQIERLEPGQALEAFRSAAKSFGAFDSRLAGRSDAALARTAEMVPVFRVTGRADPQALADRISGAPSLRDLSFAGQTAERRRA